MSSLTRNNRFWCNAAMFRTNGALQFLIRMIVLNKFFMLNNFGDMTRFKTTPARLYIY